MRVTLIVNPFASRVTEERVAAVERELSARWTVTTALTERRGHAVELARAAAGDAVVAFSGDGVFNEVLNGIERDLPVGFLPGGGANVLTRALGLPADPVEAARQLTAGRTRRISLGRVNGRRFGFSAGLGLDAEAVRRIDAMGRTPDGRRPGDLAFVWTLLRIAAERGLRWEPALEVEGLGRAALVFVSNCAEFTYAGPLALRFSPAARFELGLDVCAPERVGALSLAGYLARLAAGRGLAGARGVLHGHDLDRFEVVCDTPVALQADGEDLGDALLAVFEAERDAVAVFVA